MEVPGAPPTDADASFEPEAVPKGISRDIEQDFQEFLKNKADSPAE